SCQSLSACTFHHLILCTILPTLTTTQTYTLSLHDALPIWQSKRVFQIPREFASMAFDNLSRRPLQISRAGVIAEPRPQPQHFFQDRKSTRLNSSHGSISYAVFCLKKKNLSIQPIIHMHATT